MPVFARQYGRPSGLLFKLYGKFQQAASDILHMPFLRTLLLSSALFGLAAAQTLPAGLTRSGDVVMMQPIADNSTGGTGMSGPRPSRLHFLTSPEHDLFVRAFEAGSKGDWQAARALAAQGQNSTAKRLLEWRYALD